MMTVYGFFLGALRSKPMLADVMSIFKKDLLGIDKTSHRQAAHIE